MTSYSNTALATAELLPASKNRASAQPLRKPAQNAVLRDTAPPYVRREILPAKTKATYQPGLLSLLIGKFVAARQRAADREIARYLATIGGKFTDITEREIMRRLTC